jgi:hypothetical protein
MLSDYLTIVSLFGLNVFAFFAKNNFQQFSFKYSSIFFVAMWYDVFNDSMLVPNIADISS